MRRGEVEGRSWGTVVATEKGIDRLRRGRFAQQPERSSCSPLSRSLDQPCNFRLLPICSTDICENMKSLLSLSSLSCVHMISVHIFCLFKCIYIYIYTHYFFSYQFLYLCYILLNVCLYILVKSYNFFFSL